MGAIHVEEDMNHILHDVKDKNDRTSLLKDTDELKKDLAELKEASHAAIEHHVGPMTDAEKEQIRTDTLKIIESSSSSLASQDSDPSSLASQDSDRFWRRRRRSKK